MSRTRGEAEGTRRFRLLALATLLVVTPLGFGAKFYRGPGHVWFNDYGAGVLYEVFWILGVAFLWPGGRRRWAIPAGVFAVTSALEVAQLWHPPVLEAVRATFLGRALLGTSFVWLDFPHYVLGCLLGYAILRILDRAASKPSEAGQDQVQNGT